MTLRTVYERFLSSPNPLSLSETATLSYVTTLTSYTKQGPIVKHLENQNRNLVKKKAEKIIGAVEGHNSIALEVDTTLEFVTNGGAYLPGLDTFIVDRIATLPITHIVHFDRDEKISQIRLSWDQGSLLKQMEVIGKTGRNWPISDGKDQVKMIASGLTSVATVAPAASASRGRTEDHYEQSNRNTSPSKRYIKDPHASLDVFDPPKEDENRRPAGSDVNSIAPRESAKPPPREYSEMFAAGNENLAPSPNGSPSKAYRENITAPKGAGARRFQNSRLFEDDQDFQEPKIYKTNPARYNHFDIGDPQEDDAMQYKPKSKPEQKNVPMVARANKKMSQWDLEDSATPAKLPQRIREQDQVHFNLGDQESKQGTPAKTGQGRGHGRPDTEAHFEFLDDGTPVQRPLAQPKARKDAEHHFEFRDELTPAPRRIIARTKAAAGLYHNPLDDDDEDTANGKAPLSTIHNNAGRRKNFDSHWDATDDSLNDGNGVKKPAGENRMRAVKSMGADWDNYDKSPEAWKKPVGSKARNNMKSSWDIGDEDDASKKIRQDRNQEKGIWDF